MPTSESEPAVLIVEDQEAVRAALRELLRASFPRVRVLEAAHVAAAQEQFAAHRPMLVLTDIDLPGPSGIHLALLLKATAPQTVVIAMSIQTGRAVARRALAAGAAAFVGKDRIFEDLGPLLGSLGLEKLAP
jgi:DNA-binding NarL/FixJ family response regulator